jgi:hypothetical protein
MVSIDPRQLGALEWRQPSALNRTFELKSADSKLAELQFFKTLGTLAKASTAGGTWTFKRSGFLNPVVSAREEGSEADVATFRAKYTARSGSLTVGGETLTLRALNFWSSEWGLEDAAGHLLIRMHEKGMIHLSAKYEVTEAAKARKDLGLLLCLSWYVLVLMSEDSAS